MEKRHHPLGRMGLGSPLQTPTSCQGWEIAFPEAHPPQWVGACLVKPTWTGGCCVSPAGDGYGSRRESMPVFPRHAAEAAQFHPRRAAARGQSALAVQRRRDWLRLVRSFPQTTLPPRRQRRNGPGYALGRGVRLPASRVRPWRPGNAAARGYTIAYVGGRGERGGRKTVWVNDYLIFMGTPNSTNCHNSGGPGMLTPGITLPWRLAKSSRRLGYSGHLPSRVFRLPI